MSDKYILNDNHEPIEENDLFKWAAWFEKADRKVAKTMLQDGIKVSTVFLGLNHNYNEEGPPLLFETMIFGGDLDQEMWRYSTWKEAEEGHKKAVEKVLKLRC